MYDVDIYIHFVQKKKRMNLYFKNLQKINHEIFDFVIFSL